MTQPYEQFKLLQAYEQAINTAAIVSITDVEGKILYVNEKFIEILKYSANELLGKTHRVINSGEHPREFFTDMWKTISQGKHWRGDIKNRARDGTFYWVDSVISPVFDDNNKLIRYLSIRNLITAQKEAEQKLIQAQNELLQRKQQLKNAQQIAKTGSWHLDVKSNSLQWSTETYKIFEIPVGTPMTYELFLEKIHPDDKQRVNEAWQAALKGATYDIEHRILTPGGEKWVRELAHLEFGPLFNLVEGLGTVQEITDKKKIEQLQQESEMLYRQLFENSPFPNGILEKETMRFLMVNQAATKLYGYTEEEFKKLTAYDIRVDEEHAKLSLELEQNNYSGNRSYRTHKNKMGEILKVEPSITEISYKGKPAYLIIINNVTEKLRIQNELEKATLNRQRDITRASLEAQEKDRSLIGRELHDNVNQLLVAANLYLKNVTRDSEKDAMLLDKSLELITESIKEIRNLSWSLIPPALEDLSLKDSVVNLANNFLLTQTRVKFSMNIYEEILSPGLKINLYRIIQEQFNNIIKYAEATEVSVSMKQAGTHLTLEIIDNGKGFEQEQKPKGIGHINIIHRAETYNGKVIIESSPGIGCRIFVNFLL